LPNLKGKDLDTSRLRKEVIVAAGQNGVAMNITSCNINQIPG